MTSVLWPEEYEGFRAEAREMGAAVVTGLKSNPPAPGTDIVAASRAMITALEQTAPTGRDEVIADIPCRVFDPPDGVTRRGTYYHIHGGAMIMGSPRMNDIENAERCTRLGVRVVSVDYRLAPEHPHPAGSDDCLAVAQWVIENESGPIAIGGESAGGYFAALTLLRLRDELDAIDRIGGVNLVFGVYDLSGTPSHRGVRPTELEDVLGGNLGVNILELYVPGCSLEDARDPSISPLFASLHDMPPALFTVGLADYLLDDSLFMHARWQAYGCDGELAVYPDCIHGFTFFPIELAKRANERSDEFLDRVFSGG